MLCRIGRWVSQVIKPPEQERADNDWKHETIFGGFGPLMYRARPNMNDNLSN